MSELCIQKREKSLEGSFDEKLVVLSMCVLDLLILLKMTSNFDKFYFEFLLLRFTKIPIVNV